MNGNLPLVKNIKKARISSGLSQKDLAKKLGVTDKTISAYETGRAIPPMPTLTRIAKYTNKSISEILGIEENNNSKVIVKKLENIEKKIAFLGPIDTSGQELKLDAFVGIVLKNNIGQIFLIKQRDKNNISNGKWNLPCGSVEKDEGFVEAGVRELKEKTGLNTKIISLLGCYKCKKSNNTWIYIVFEGKLVGNDIPSLSSDIIECKWFTKEEYNKLNDSEIVHPDMRLVYNMTSERKGLSTSAVKYIKYK
jgi:transcriptional regulator with XRE-family HTH domain